MTLYAIVLFFHVAAVLGLFASLSFEVLALFHLRRASDLTEVRSWIDPVPGLPLLAMTSLLVIFASGIYLAMRMSAFDAAWPKVTIAALLLIAPLGALSGRRMSAIRRDSGHAKGMSAELIGRLQDPFLRISLGIRIGVFLGIVLLMGAKPALWQSISVAAGSALLGVVFGLLFGLRSAALAAPSTDSGV
jgi:hypothetical protein